MKETSDLQEEIKLCNSFFAFVKYLFESEIGPDVQLDLDNISQMIKGIINSVRKNHCNLMLALYETGDTDENYIYLHTLRTVILSLIIGNELKLPNHKLIELGTAALLHDIGMFSLPKDLYLKPIVLSEKEKKLIQNHPIYGYKFLDTYNLSPAVKIAVLDHHEREDGTGYPRNLAGEKISLFGKIIAVACSFEAISSDRVYKKPVDTHTGIINILKNKTKYYNTAVQALVNSLSIYPV